MRNLAQKQFDIGDDTKDGDSKLITTVFRKGLAMTSKEHFEQTTSIASLGRDELKRRIKGFRGRFKLDFNEDYLNNISIDRLRHILLAALINLRSHN